MCENTCQCLDMPGVQSLRGCSGEWETVVVLPSAGQQGELH